MQRDKPIDFIEMPGHSGKLGIILLQRPAALNAIDESMVCAIHQQLTQWASDSVIKAVVIRSTSGRAFCAGGDIRSLYEKKIKNDPTVGDFFKNEYQVNRQIFHYQKPYIALLDGITMGGGAGISIHGSHRVATPHLSFSMPETSIGYFPDIGGSYFLSRLPHKIGFYLGLTSERISYSDCLALGLVDTVIAADTQEQLIKKLAESALPDKAAVTRIIQPFSITTPASPLWAHHKEIERCFTKNTVEEILNALESENNEWCLKTAAIIHTKSPSSLKITLRALQKGSCLDFDACMQMEERLAISFMNSHDLFEGIRAVVIDKDHMPRWKPATLGQVTEEWVGKHFE